MSAPFVTTSRDTLAAGLCDARDQREHYQGAVGTACGYCYDLADKLIETGGVVTVESLATDEALIELVAADAWFGIDNPRPTEHVRRTLTALAVALGAKP